MRRYVNLMRPSSLLTSASNSGGRRRQGETISTAFVESTINQVVSRRFLKQQMQWTLRDAYLLPRTRTKVLNNELETAFRRWYPRFRAKAADPDFLTHSRNLPLSMFLMVH